MSRSSKLCRASIGILVVVLVLQMAAVASPGWLVYIEGNMETYLSVFYKLKCETQAELRCEARSLKDIYKDVRSNHLKATVSRKTIAGLDRKYNEEVLRQVLLIVAIGCSLGALVLQFLRSEVDKKHVRIIVLSIGLCGLSAGLLLSVVCDFVVEIYYQGELLTLDGHVDNTYVGFPYSIAMVLGSVLLQFAVIFTLGAHLYVPKVKLVKKRRPSISYIDYSEEEPKETPTVIKSVTPPVTKKQMPVVSPPVIVTTNDSQVLSEKL